MARWRATALVLLAATSLPAAAQSMTCGTFADADGGSVLTVEAPDRALRQFAGVAPQPQLLRRDGERLSLADLDSGLLRTLTVRDNGHRLSDEAGGSEYRLQRAARCLPSTTAPAGTCRADIASCLDTLASADNDRLRQWCGEQVPAACKRLLENYVEDARRGGQAAAEDAPDIEEPEVCRSGSARFNESACREAAREVLGKAMSGVIAGAFGPSASAPLPAARLDEISRLCRAQGVGGFCTDAAAALWDAGRLADGRDALQRACTQGKDPDACGKVEALAGHTLQAVPATALPCGSYLASQGLMEHLPFGDGGMVDSGFGGKLRARLQDGQVRIRHDKGDDFVFQPLANGDLVGIDSWNRYAYYQHQPGIGPSQCNAPVVYVETPLPQDCPTLTREGGAQACCAAGKLQGCNAAGHQLALRERWAEAAPFYLKVCRAGVREGCENLATVYAHTGDEALPEALQQVCESDGKGTHVACDVHATRNWALMQVGAGLEEIAARMAAEAEAEVEADAEGDAEPEPANTPADRAGDEAPARAHGNRKR